MLLLPFTVDSERLEALDALDANRTVVALFSFVASTTSDDEKEQFIAFALARNRSVLAGLDKAIETVKALEPSFDFWNVVLPRLIASVKSIANKEEATLRILRKGERGKVSYERTVLFGLLAGAFFQLLPDVSQLQSDLTEEEQEGFGALSFSRFLIESTRIGSQRLACLLLYFHCVITAPTPQVGSVCFERLHCPLDAMPDLTTLNDVAVVPKLSRLPFMSIGDKQRIEDVDADAHVDFANKQVHIGMVIASATQEEVLFSIRPECFAAILLFEVLADDEAALVHGAHRYCQYKGYLNSFTLTGRYPPEDLPPAVVIIDAHMNSDDSQFNEGVVERDIFKAYLGFKSVPCRGEMPSSDADELDRMPLISTGGWGCGIFRGDQFLKFVQQAIAASMAQCRLVYSSFGNTERAETLKLLAHKLQSNETKIAEMMQWIAEFRAQVANDDEGEEVMDFELFLLSKFVKQKETSAD